MMDQFCLSEACIIADLLQHFENKGISFDPSYVYSDVYRALSWVHTSGLLHRSIMENVPKFLERSSFLPDFLKRLRAAGKKVFLLTNSGYQFIDAGLSYLLEPNWTDYFDYVMVQSGKPDFFLSNRRPFRQIDRKTGHIRWDKVADLERGQVYVDGNLAVREFLQVCGSKLRQLMILVPSPLSGVSLDDKIERLTSRVFRRPSVREFVSHVRLS